MSAIELVIVIGTTIVLCNLYVLIEFSKAKTEVLRLIGPNLLIAEQVVEMILESKHPSLKKFLYGKLHKFGTFFIGSYTGTEEKSAFSLLYRMSCTGEIRADPEHLNQEELQARRFYFENLRESLRQRFVTFLHANNEREKAKEFILHHLMLYGVKEIVFADDLEDRIQVVYISRNQK